MKTELTQDQWNALHASARSAGAEGARQVIGGIILLAVGIALVANAFEKIENAGRFQGPEGESE